MNCKEKLEEYLRAEDVLYGVQHHPRAFTAQDVAASEHLPGRFVAKVVMVVVDEKMVMVVLPAPERVHLPELGRVMGARTVRLAEEAEFAHLFPDCEVGAMPPFGNLYDVPVFVDAALTHEKMIFFQAGTHVDTMSMKYEDYERLVQPKVAAFSMEEVFAG